MTHDLEKTKAAGGGTASIIELNYVQKQMQSIRIYIELHSQFFFKVKTKQQKKIIVNERIKKTITYIIRNKN